MFFNNLVELNKSLLFFCNQLFVNNAFISKFFVYFNILGTKQAVLAVLGLIFLWVILNSYFQKFYIEPKPFRAYLLKWFEVSMVMSLSIVLLFIITPKIKKFSAQPRPLCVYKSDKLNVLLEHGLSLQEIIKKRCTNADGSFPSAHSGIVTVFAASLWAISGFYARSLLVAMVLLMGFSRLATGVHYPVDVIGGCILASCIVLLVKKSLQAMIPLFAYRNYNVSK